MSSNLSAGIDSVAGAAVGRALGRGIATARARRLTQEASGHFGEGEQLAAPVANCTRGVLRRVLMFTALGIDVLAIVAMFSIADRVFGSRAGPVIFAVIAAGFLLLLALIVPRKYAVALTDRRLLVFRRGRVLGRHIQGVLIAVARSDVSTSFKRISLDGGVLSLQFAPATGQAPIQLNFEGSQVAGTIHLYLATATTRNRPPHGQPGRPRDRDREALIFFPGGTERGMR